MAPFLIVGVLACLAGLLAFLIIHHFCILPIWFILPPGLVIAVLGGLAVGWSYHEIRLVLPLLARGVKRQHEVDLLELTELMEARAL